MNWRNAGSWLGRVGVMAMLATVAATAVDGADTPAAGLACMEPVCSFGALGPEKTVRHTFVLTNAGERVALIGAVRAGCGCLTATLATNAVPPGGTVELAAEMTLAGRRGEQRKTIYVESDAAASPLRLEFEGTVVPPIEVTPEGLHFGTLAATGDVERVVTVAAVGAETFRIRGVASSSTQFSAEIETDEAGKRYRLRIRSVGPRRLGTCTASVRVETDHPAMPVVMVPVTVFVAADVVAAPSSLMLIEPVTNTPRTYYVNVYSPGKQAFKIEEVRAPGAGIETRVASLAADRHRVELRFPGVVRELDGTQLVIRTDMESVREIQVPLRVIAQPTK